MLGVTNSISAQTSLEKRLTINIKNKTLEESLFLLIDKASVNLSFSNNIIPKKLVDVSLVDQPLKVILTKMFEGTLIGFKQIGEQIVLYQKPESIVNKYTISGFLEDAETGERLIGASIWNRLDGKGTTTNAYGFYSLTLKEGPVDLIFSYIGFEPQKHTFKLDEDYPLNLQLGKAITLSEVVVLANDSFRQEIPFKTGISLNEVSVQQLDQLPSLGGETDLIRTFQLFPGVATGTDGIGGLMVRGGNAGQNLILIDGVPVYDFSHGGGVFSIFNPVAVSKATLIKGGFPARYNGRLSSILDIRTKDGNRKHFEGRLDLSLLSARVALEGPIVEDKTSFFLSGRTSFLNWYIAPVAQRWKTKNGEDGTVTYDFYDFNIKLNHEFSKKDKVMLSVYSGGDDYFNTGVASNDLWYERGNDWVRNNQSYNDDWTLNNNVMSLRWNHLITDKLFSNLTLIRSKFSVNYLSESSDLVHDIESDTLISKDLAFRRYESSIEDNGIKLEFDFIPAPGHFLRFGASYVDHRFSPGILTFEENTEYLNNSFANSAQTAEEISGYLEDEFTIDDKLNFNIGLSFINWKTGQTTYQSWQPRFSLYYALHEQLGLKASYSKMAQFVHRLSESSFGQPTDLWVPSTDNIAPQQSDQFGLGLEYIPKSGLNFTLEGYYKDMQNLLAYSEGAIIIQDWENNVTIGNGRAYGMEFLAQKSIGQTTGWMSYTLSWADRQFERINFGERFPFAYDRRHDFKIALRHQFNKWLSVSGNWVYNTGRAITMPTENYVIIIPGNRDIPSGVLVTDFGGKNQFRMPDYHRLDLSIQANLNGKDNLKHMIGIGAYNLYDRKNPLYYRIKKEYSFHNGYVEVLSKEFVQAWLIPIMPYIQYSFQF